MLYETVANIFSMQIYTLQKEVSFSFPVAEYDLLINFKSILEFIFKTFFKNSHMLKLTRLNLSTSQWTCVQSD